MNKLWTFGCSFTADWDEGNLPGEFTNPYVLFKKWRGGEWPPVWPYVLGNLLGYETINHGHGGNSNYKIMMDIMEDFDKFSKGDVVVVEWSVVNRFLLSHKNGNGPALCSILPSNHSNDYPISSDCINQVIVDRDNDLWKKEVYAWEEMIEEHARVKEYEVYFWTIDGNLIYTKPDEFKNKKKYPVSMGHNDLLGYIKKCGGLCIWEETNREVFDVHFGESGHRVTATKIYNHIKKYRDE